MRSSKLNFIPHHTPFVFSLAFSVGMIITAIATTILLKYKYLNLEFKKLDHKISQKQPSLRNRHSQNASQLKQPSKIDSGDLKEHFNTVLNMESEKQFFEDVKVESPKVVHHEYMNVHCVSKTVISIDLNGKQKKIHANLLQGWKEKYISAQCPATSDSLNDERLELFWKMAFDHSSLICDLAGPRKIPQYYPDIKQTDKQYSAVTVSYLSEKIVQTDPDVKVIDYNVTYNGETRTVHRLVYDAWPSNGYVEPEVLKSLCRQITAFKGNQPPIFHDRSGLGWSATLLTACEMTARLEESTEGWDNSRDKIDELIQKFRMQRDPRFIQTYDQYISLYHLVCSYLN
jgi:protein tyrosine phosphatase